MCVFFFNDTATTEIYTLSLHDALPIWLERTSSCAPAISSDVTSCPKCWVRCSARARASRRANSPGDRMPCSSRRSEEHTSELQSRQYLVCRLLLEKKNTYSPQLSLSTR